jgi:hypothetical protein
MSIEWYFDVSIYIDFSQKEKEGMWERSGSLHVLQYYWV